MKEADYRVYVSERYEDFKILDGNREVRQQRVSAIEKSVKNVGWIRNPILVNEKMEIIDGQGRFEVLKKLGYPIEFIIDDGIGIEECRSMNIKQTNWTSRDFIDSYAELSNTNYMFLKNLIEQFPRISLTVINCSVNDGAQISQSVVKEGNFKCSEEDYNNAKKVLSFIDRLLPYILKIEGNISYLQCAIIFIYKYTEAEMDRIEMVLQKYSHEFTPVATVESALRDFERFYNSRLRSGHQNFVNDYKYSAKGKKAISDRVRNRYADYDMLDELKNRKARDTHANKI